MAIQKTLKLNTGAQIPLIGLGTWKAAPGQAGSAVYEALRAGYRHIDCAENYGNESEIGVYLKKAFDEGFVKRADVFITSKLNNPYHKKDMVLPALKRSLKALQLDYLDLYLMHWPIAFPYVDPKGDPDCSGLPKNSSGQLHCPPTVPVHETWPAMEALMATDLVKAIGVSNFTGALLFDLLTYAKIVPAVNQIELHPLLAQPRMVEFCATYGIVVTAYCPLGSDSHSSGGMNLFTNDVISKIAKKYNKSSAQILLRWSIERGVVAIPKSCNSHRIAENISIFDFQLSAQDMIAISSLDKNLRLLNPWDWYKGSLFI